MKSLKYIVLNKNSLKNIYKYSPETKEELQSIIIDLLKSGETNLNCIDVSNITDMSMVFCEVNKCITINDIDISGWDVSNVKIMSHMFYACDNLKKLNISDWDVSNVEDMQYMFDGCKKIQLNISNWNVSNVNTFTSMFKDCEKFNCNISKWDLSNAKYTNRMFENCYNFNYDLNNLNINASCYIRCMFSNCTKLSKNNRIPKWYIKFCSQTGNMNY